MYGVAFYSIDAPSSETNHRPFGEKTAQFTTPECPSSICNALPSTIFGSHSWMVLSYEVEAIRPPSGDQATRMSTSPCPDRVFMCLPVVAFQIRTVLSPEAEASCRLSGDHQRRQQIYCGLLTSASGQPLLRIPYTNRIIVRARGYALPIRGPRHREDPTGMSFEAL